MAKQVSKSDGGIHFGNVAGPVEIKPGGDLVGGDKVTNTSSLKNTLNQAERNQFQRQVSELVTMMQEVRAAMETAVNLDQNERDAIRADLARVLIELGNAKKNAATLPDGIELSSEPAGQVKSSLEKAGTLLKQVDEVSGRAADLGEKVGLVLQKVLPLLASARHLFGLP